VGLFAIDNDDFLDGHNGHSNGINGVLASPRRIPPGGYSSKLW